ncbi:MAG TPA: ATP-binding protein [Actinocrinis sp.]|jgi:signal transduction histidine kinase
MIRTRSSPHGSHTGSPLLISALVPASLAALGTVFAVVAVAPGARPAVALFGLAAVFAVGLACAEAARRGRALTGLRRRHAAAEQGLERRLSLQEAHTARLASEVLPEAIGRLLHGDSIEEVLAGTAHDRALGPRSAQAHHAVVRSVLEAVKAEEDLRDSAQRAFVNVARRVQAIVHQQFQDLREMEERHGGSPDVFDDLLHIDHGTALIGRLADSLAVLGGSRPGRQWPQAVPLFNVLRGAMSRITDYQRVDLHSVAEVAVAGTAVEPLIHALAELLDNATRYSPPHTRVHLTAIEVQSGVAIEIEDGGVGLSDEGRARAERVLAQVSAGLDLADLGESPRLGLSVVGRLAQANRFQVSLRPSAYAGVRAVLVIPRDLITMVPVPAPTAGAAADPSRPVPVMSMPPGRADGAHRVEVNANGLPQRRRAVTKPPGAAIPRDTPIGDSMRALGAVLAAPAAEGPDAPPPSRAAPAGGVPGPPASPGSEVLPPPPGLWLAAFHNAVSGDTAADAAGHPGSDEPSSKESE